MKSMLLIIGLAGLLATQSVSGAPTPMRDDVQVRRLAGMDQNTIRLAKDPRDNTLFAIVATGDIQQITIDEEGGSATKTTLFRRADHGLSVVRGFAIGPDGSFYLAANEAGTSGMGNRVARGVLVDADTGAREWSTFDLNDAPAGVPIDDVVAGFGTIIVLDPVSGTRYAVRNNEVTLVPSGTVASAEDHGLAKVGGIFIDAEGTFYLTENLDFSGHNIATIVKGERNPDNNDVEWFVLAKTEPIEQCDCIFNHQVNGIAVSPDNKFIFVNSGSKTDHGEVQDNRGRFPGMRETGLTTLILRIPTDVRDEIIPNDREKLRANGMLFAAGVRNGFDLAFAANGDLFATENAPDRDSPEELNWIREGHHFGFPWVLALEDNPQRDPNYDPDNDFLLPSGFNAVRNDFYHNDPTFPAPPADFSDPVINIGPDADSYRDPADGIIKDASDEGVRFATFTAHRSPLGLVFDTDMAMGGEFQGDGFVTSWTEGDPNGDSVNGPFKDPSEDLLHLDLEKMADGSNYTARVTRIVGGFSNPIDTEIVGKKIYLIEWSGGRGLWEITLPSATPTAVLEESGALPTTSALAQNYPNPFNPSTTIHYSVGEAATVELTIYDAVGQKVRTLVDQQVSAGSYAVRWNALNDAGFRVASGTYIYRLVVGDFQQSKSLTLLK